MDKLRMQTLDGVQNNIDKIAMLFPNCITERKDAKGKVSLAIDFDKLRQELSSEIVEGREERYQFTWPDKKKAVSCKLAYQCDTSSLPRGECRF